MDAGNWISIVALGLVVAGWIEKRSREIAKVRSKYRMDTLRPGRDLLLKIQESQRRCKGPEDWKGDFVLVNHLFSTYGTDEEMDAMDNALKPFRINKVVPNDKELKSLNDFFDLVRKNIRKELDIK